MDREKRIYALSQDCRAVWRLVHADGEDRGRRGGLVRLANRRGGVAGRKQIGVGNDDAEQEAVKAAARQRIAAGSPSPTRGRQCGT